MKRSRLSDSQRPAEAAAWDREIALDLMPSLRPVVGELEAYERLLQRWQETVNLVAAGTLQHIWTRHFADSAQVVDAFPEIVTWADLGSGAGFPGLVMALCLKPRPGAMVHLIEGDQRKASFLRAVSRETGAPACVHVGRIESELPRLEGQIKGIVARALAPLPQLIDWSKDHLLKNAIGVFLKGEDWLSELTDSSVTGSFEVRTLASRTNPAARIIAVARDFGA